MCPSYQCTCRRCGLKCVAACGTCRGDIWENAEKLIIQFFYTLLDIAGYVWFKIRWVVHCTILL